MTEEEKTKTKDLFEEWIKEVSKIEYVNEQPKNGARLDNGNSGEYTKIAKKYQKLIEERLGKKIWNKKDT